MRRSVNDTSPDVKRIYREMLMRRTPADRLVMGARMFDAARALALASFPDGLSPAEKRHALLTRFYPGLVDLENLPIRRMK